MILKELGHGAKNMRLAEDEFINMGKLASESATRYTESAETVGQALTARLKPGLNSHLQKLD